MGFGGEMKNSHHKIHMESQGTLSKQTKQS